MKKDKKLEQLGMPIGTASNRLRKSIIFNFLIRLNENICYQCKQKIELENELSIEHKIPWLDSENPIDLFFNLDNIAFSHLNCNVGAGRKIRKIKNIDDKRLKHGSSGYKRGCRCDECKCYKKIENSKRVY